MFRRNFRILAILTFIFCPIVAQQDEGFFYGQLSDANTGEPVVFATIRLMGKSLGVISNNDGGFKIPSEFELKGDSLVISSIGYETKRVGFAILSKNKVNQIRIKPSVFELSETTVTANKRGRATRAKINTNLTAKQIIRHAIEQIPYNYPSGPFELVGYYRDYQLREKEYINLNEALIKVFDGGFANEDYNSLQFGLYDYKSNLEFGIDSFAAKPYDYRSKDKYIPNTVFSSSIVPNELLLLFNHDAIRHNKQMSYSFIDVFAKDFIKKHDFYTYFVTNYGDKKVYKIKFRKSLMRFEVKGDIYIDSDTYAIRKMDYALYRKGSGETSDSNELQSEMDLLYEILVEYQEFEDYMYLNYISFHNKFKLVRPPKFYIEDVVRKYDTRELLIVLNKPAKNWYSLKSKDIKIYYGEERLRVDGLSQIDNSSYKFKFSKNSKTQRKKVRRYFREAGTKKEKPLVVDISNLMDLDGNILGKENSELLNQFREFFTQRVIVEDHNEVKGAMIVDKQTSLGNPKQPKIKAGIDEDFWMNTPLKSKE